MVKVREDQPLNADGTVNIESWIERLQQDAVLTDVATVRRACELSQQLEQEAIAAGKIWSENASSFRTGLEMADILSELRLDQDSLVAAILYRSVREGQTTLELIRKEFGNTVAKLIEGVLQMAAISTLQQHTRQPVLGQTQAQVDNVRKMLVAMVDDVRVALIKLAERTCAIRAVKSAPREKRLQVAREVFDIYAPLAHRLGIGHLKWELEDLSFRYLEEDEYKYIAKLLAEKRKDRDQYISNVVNTLQQALAAQGIEANLSGRAKHIYSIWRKMKRKNIDFSQVYDVRAVRVLVPEVKDCYAALGIVHSLWRHIPHEFDDYIATPKENGYRSLHTAVIGPEGKVLEVQIRTHEMHEEAELGVCAHWRYKGTDAKGGSSGYEEKIAWLRQVLEWHEELGDLGALEDQLHHDAIASDRAYVFTPDGHVVDLPSGATPIDFAYRVHTEVGHRCRGAKVNGRIVPLTYPLKTGEQVEILTSKNGGPSRDWLNPNLGYVKTSRARAKIQQWLKQQAREQNVEAGHAQLEREFQRLALSGLNLEKLARKVNYHSVEDMYAAIGAGDLRTGQVLRAAQALFGVETEDSEQQRLDRLLSRPKHKREQDSDITINGVGNLMTHMAGCCKPLPGDDIIGYITQGRGVTIHRKDCSNALQLQEEEPERIINVEWGRKSESNLYPVDIRIVAWDRSGLLRDITAILANEKVNVLSVNTLSNKTEHQANMLLTLEVDGLEVLGKVLGKINQLPNVVSVMRYKEGAR